MPVRSLAALPHSDLTWFRMARSPLGVSSRAMRDGVEEGTPSMDTSSTATRPPDPDAVEFVRFCYRRRRVGWPELYDEMCAVAGRGLFRGYGADDLAAFGIGFSLFHMPALSVLASRIVCEEQALRRPIRVTLSEADAPTHATLETRTAVPIRPAIVPDQELDRDAPTRLVMAAVAG
jgi:hypothetical protein